MMLTSNSFLEAQPEASHLDGDSLAGRVGGFVAVVILEYFLQLMATVRSSVERRGYCVPVA